MKVNTKSILPGVTLAVFLSGCASTNIGPFFPPVNTQITVNEEITSPNSTRVYIQNGTVRHRRDVAVINPNCQFVLTRAQSDTSGLQIKPGTFNIDRVFRESQRGTVNSTMMTFMEISSDTQPEVTRLVCQRWGSPTLDNFVTIKEMKATLAPLVTLNFPDE